MFIFHKYKVSTKGVNSNKHHIHLRYAGASIVFQKLLPTPECSTSRTKSSFSQGMDAGEGTENKPTNTQIPSVMAGDNKQEEEQRTMRRQSNSHRVSELVILGQNPS